MSKAKKAGLIALAVVGLLLFAIALTRAHVGLLGPHATRPSGAALDPALKAAIEYQLGGDEKPKTVEQAIRFSLKQTGARLRFGLGHPTHLGFGVEPREGNCIEYANLFVKIFGMAAEKGKLQAKAYVVHSARAEIFGAMLPLPSLRDHDWVLVVDETPGEKRSWYVDPAFDDTGLGWDLKANVQGDVAPGK